MASFDEKQIDEIYAMGELTIEEFKLVKEKFVISCKFCGSNEIAIMTKTDDDGYCETCSSPYARVTLKCKECGQGISIRN